MDHLIFPCSKTPELDQTSATSCVDEIAQQYAFDTFLGAGTKGMAIRVKNMKTSKYLVVKILPLDQDGVNEIQTQCTLSDIKRETGIFVKAYGWQVCEDIPEAWDSKLEDNDFPLEWDAPDKVLFIFMEETAKRWTDREELGIRKDERRAIVFLLLHGLYVARRELEFTHEDIHEENIMLQPKDTTKPVVVKVGTQEFVIPAKVRFVPKLIDYGYSRTKYSPALSEGEDSFSSEDEEDDLFGPRSVSGSEGTTDLSSLAFVFPEIDSIITEKVRASTGKDYKVLEKVLFNNYFSVFIDKENTNVTSRVLLLCNVCMAPARVQYKNLDENTFCDVRCAHEFWI